MERLSLEDTITTDLNLNQEKIKVILHVAENLSSGRGIPKFILNLLKYLPQDNIKISVLQSNWCDFVRIDLEKEEYTFLKKYNIMTYNDSSQKFHFLTNNPFLSKLYYFFIKQILFRIDVKQLQKDIKEELARADILYLTSNYYGYLKKINTKIIGSCHTFFANSGLLGTMIVALTKAGFINRFKCLHAFPGYEKYFLNRDMCMFTLPLWVDTNLFFPRKRPKNEKVKLLYVAALTKGKGFDLLIDSFGKLDKNVYELHVVGKGKFKEMPQDSSIIFHEAASDVSLAEIYSQCDIFVYPTRLDTYGTVILEALSSGLIVVTSNILDGVFNNFRDLGYLIYTNNDSSSIANTTKYMTKRILEYEDRLKLRELVSKNNDVRNLTLKFGEYLIQIAKKYRNNAKI